MWNFFIEGINHITDPGGYDHMLFLVALCAPFLWRSWIKVVFLATAFTIGHSISLVLAAFNILRFHADIVEVLIPITILLTSLSNIHAAGKSIDRVSTTNYILTTTFGVIHGMGFSSYFRMILDEATSFTKSLLAFNLGVEIGQLLIIVVFLFLSALVQKLKSDHRKFVIGVSILTGLLASYMILELCLG